MSNPAQLQAMGLESQSAGRFAEAESLYRQALGAWELDQPNFAEQAALTRGLLGGLLTIKGRYAEAEPLLIRCLNDAEARAGPDSLEAGRTVLRLATLYRAWHRWSEAERFAQRAVRIFDRYPSEAASQGRASTLVVATIDADLGRNREAEALLSSLADPADAGALRATSYNNRAAIALGQQRLADAESLLRRAFELIETAAVGAPVRAAMWNNLAQLRRFQKNYLDAEKYYRQAIDLWKQALGERHPNVAKSYMNLAAFYHERGRESGAEDLYRRAAEILESTYSREDPLPLVARNELAEVLRAERRFSESERLALATHSALEKAVGSGDPRFLRALENYARLLDDLKRREEATTVRKRAKRLFSLNQPTLLPPQQP